MALCGREGIEGGALRAVDGMEALRAALALCGRRESARRSADTSSRRR